MGFKKPIVEALPELSAEERERASRQIILEGFGETGQKRLSAARVLVVGAGGLGSALVPYLVGAGLGTIGIVDDDVVELSNLHRQVAHKTSRIGQKKVDSLAAEAAALNPGVNIVTRDQRLTSANALEIFAGYDLILDGSDNFATRYLTSDAAEILGIPLVWGSILGFYGQVSISWPGSVPSSEPSFVSDATSDAASDTGSNSAPGYRDLFPNPPAPGDVDSCATGGVLPGLCGTIGSLMATEAMKLITGIGTPLIGRVLVYDSLKAATRQLEYDRDPAREPLKELIDYELFCGVQAEPPSIDIDTMLAEFAAGKTVILDVRTREEHAAKHIRGAELIPLDELQELSEFPAAWAGKTIAVYCLGGPRSITAANHLRGLGLNAKYLPNGISAITSHESVVSH